MEIKTIPPKKIELKRRRVAAYARVSRDSEELLHSLANQVSYYTKHISSRPDWELAGIYVDEGITGTSTEHRDDFLRMMEDARQGKIDLIITKSVSRFARNTVDLLKSVRELKSRNVEVRFEKDGISTFDGEGELILSLMASFAQAESESISENVKWGKRKQMREGIYHHAYPCYGYRWEGDVYAVVRDEAEVIRFIFRSYLSGVSPKHIADQIMASGMANCSFTRCKVKDILKNRIYVGDRILQRFFSPKIRKRARNYGEVPQYVLEDVHEAIISREEFDQAQKIMKERAEKTPAKTFTCFSGKVKCGECGRSFCRRNYHGGKIWKCQGKELSRTCSVRSLYEEELRSITFSIFTDEEDFKRNVNCIRVFDDRLIFEKTDGKSVTRNRPGGWK